MLDTALSQLRDRLERGADDGYTRIEIAAIEGIRGNADDAVRWMEAAFDARFRYYREIEIDPVFDRMRGIPGFERVMGRMRAVVEGMRRRVMQQEIELEAARASRRQTG